MIQGRQVMELGCGAGVAAVCLCRHPVPMLRSLLLTDGDTETIANLRYNLEINGVKAETCMPSSGTADHERDQDATEDVGGPSEGVKPGICAKQLHKDPPAVQCLQLVWEDWGPERLAALQADVVLGADIVYNPECIPALVQVLYGLLVPQKADDAMHPTDLSKHNHITSLPKYALIVTTLRNESTLALFLDECRTHDLYVEDMTSELAANPKVQFHHHDSLNRSRMFIHKLQVASSSTA